MKRLLVLARGNGRAFADLDGRSIVSGLPFPVAVLVDKPNAKHFQGLDGEVAVEVVRWSDREDVRRRARRWNEGDGLSGIAVLEEELVDFAAELRAELCLPGLRPEEAARFRDKLTMKQVLAAAGLRVPEFALCSDTAAVARLLEKHGRLVVKPVDGRGSREVGFVASVEELDRWAARAHNHSTFEAEEYIDGVLYHVNAIVRDGTPILTATAPYLPGMANIDFAAGTPFVSVLLKDGDLKDRLEAFSTRAIAALGLKNGVTHMECFVTPGGEIVFCETAARPGGGGIVLMIEGQYGVNVSRALLLLEGGRGDLVRIAPKETGAVLGLMGIRHPFSGIVKRAPTPATFPEPWIRYRRVDTAPGDFVAGASHCTDFVGLLIFWSRDGAEFDARRVELYDRFCASLEIQPV